MHAGDDIHHSILRYLNRRTLRVIVPTQYSRDHDLDAGDHVVWIPEPNGDVRLKFVRTRQQAEADSA